MRRLAIFAFPFFFKIVLPDGIDDEIANAIPKVQERMAAFKKFCTELIYRGTIIRWEFIKEGILSLLLQHQNQNDADDSDADDSDDSE